MNTKQSHTPTPWDVMHGKTLCHVETRSDNQAGAGIAVCSIPKARYEDAAFIVKCVNIHVELLQAAKDVVLCQGKYELNRLANIIAKAEGK